jgi:hypothetical protein
MHWLKGLTLFELRYAVEQFKNATPSSGFAGRPVSSNCVVTYSGMWRGEYILAEPYFMRYATPIAGLSVQKI